MSTVLILMSEAREVRSFIGWEFSQLGLFPSQYNCIISLGSWT